MFAAIRLQRLITDAEPVESKAEPEDSKGGSPAAPSPALGDGLRPMWRVKRPYHRKNEIAAEDLPDFTKLTDGEEFEASTPCGYFDCPCAQHVMNPRGGKRQQQFRLRVAALFKWKRNFGVLPSLPQIKEHLVPTIFAKNKEMMMIVRVSRTAPAPRTARARRVPAL